MIEDKLVKKMLLEMEIEIGMTLVILWLMPVLIKMLLIFNKVD